MATGSRVSKLKDMFETNAEEQVDQRRQRSFEKYQTSTALSEESNLTKLSHLQLDPAGDEAMLSDLKKSGSDHIFSNARKFMALFKTGGLDSVILEIQSELKRFQDTVVHIAVTGESGTGKSSFINALRGVSDTDMEAAGIGEMETTMEPTKYKYPNRVRVAIWDLPGIGTPNFQAATYLERVEFDRYDLFLIVSTTRFKENDMFLAKAIQERGKKFYFIRNKIDQDLKSKERRSMSQYDQKEALRELYKSSLDNLTKGGIESPQIFLISCWYMEKFHFEALLEVLEQGLPDLKRRLFSYSLPNVTSKVIDRKKVVMLSEIWKDAFYSAVAAAAPVPGLTTAYNITSLVTKLSQCRADFGLDDNSLRRLANRMRNRPEELKLVVQSTFGVEVSAGLIQNELSKLSGPVGKLQKAVKYLPFVRQVTAGKSTYTATYSLLKTAIEEMAEDAKRVIVTAFSEN
ncbi:interferon-inducible GTPase 5-like [Chiloscyllium plagiosum]|uniref:interferon-inducible GTPase 5-like n=1 Tax=Chiloscyllium plagiosum TaxID=36176 RepID=UPI001CB819EE|nr:interferon-inducible GTPase 5-like [Chiloscyllium plagiosum]XP_043542676.1 interferon-inducible GTPase 5-like [Chiloscyllium plagiosum]XP_043542677.1 interferon-inducible GTPase 5-like [Chiloscyllium plagiosum]